MATRKYYTLSILPKMILVEAIQASSKDVARKRRARNCTQVVLTKRETEKLSYVLRTILSDAFDNDINGIAVS